VKKILSSLAILATILGMTTSIAMAKTFTDVKDTKYEEAVDILSELKVISGYEDNTYKPSNSVKRSEMAKLIIVAMGKENGAKILEGDTTFSDVGATHWASGYINYATKLEIIKGYPDGTFRPDATVSYVEAATMLLRALNYGTELDGLSWPTGYMSKANSAGLLSNVVSNSSSDSAIRGNVANMILNTMKANTKKVIASNSTGNTYGEDKTLIEKSFTDLIYVKSGIVTNINVDKKELTIKDEDNERNIEVVYNDSTSIKTMFGSEVSFIYDKKKEDFLYFEILNSLKVKIVDVKEINADEWILIDKDGNEYDMPKSSNILFFGTSRYVDIDKAYISLDNNNKVTYLVLEGEEELFAGIVYDIDVKVDDKKAVEIVDTDGKYRKLVLANQSEKLKENEVILFAYNNSDQIIIRAEEVLKDAIDIETVSKTELKLEDEKKISFSNSENYSLYMIDSLAIKIYKSTLSEVNAQYDKATVLKINDKYHIIVFMDSVTEDEAKSEAKKALNTALSNAKKKKEETYSVVTYEKLRDAVEYGNRIYSASASYSTNMIQLAATEINEAINNLVKATSADKDLRAAFSKLKAKITAANALDAKDYTEASFKKVSTALASAKSIVIESTTVAKVNTATNNLTSAMNLLVTNTSASQIVDAIKRLDTAINDAKAKKSSNAYTSYADLDAALTAAGKVDRTTASARELNNVAANIEAAIDALIPKQLGTYKTERDKLDTKIAETLRIWEDFNDLYPAIKTAYESLDDYDDVAKMTITNIQAETEKVKKIYKDVEDALKELTEKTDATLRKNSINTINTYLAEAEKYKTEDEWKEVSETSWTVLQNKIKKAKDALATLEDSNNSNDVTTATLKDIADELQLFIPLN